MSQPRQPRVPRRRALTTALLAALFGRRAEAAAAASEPAVPAPLLPPWMASLRVLAAPEPIRQIHAGGPTGVLAITASGALWALRLDGAAPQRLGEGLDPATPPASGHGRIAARTAHGGLWLWEQGRSRVTQGSGLAVHAGLLILPLAVIAVVTDGASHRLVRLEPDSSGAWHEVARAADAVLPDARPLQVDMDGRGDGGHVVVLAGPDSERYAHAVLGDGVEATRLLWLERHGLVPMRELTLPAPHVFEDIAPRPVVLASGSGLLTMRSGPEGAQLALIAADPANATRLRIAALGATLGARHRWMAATTDGQHWLAVHTPHIGGVLHAYRLDGERLASRRLAGDVSSHRIGARETDLGVWLGPALVLPSQDRRRLRWFDVTVGAELTSVALPAAVVMTAALPAPQGLLALLDDGRLVLATAAARGAATTR